MTAIFGDGHQLLHGIAASSVTVLVLEQGHLRGQHQIEQVQHHRLRNKHQK